MKALTLCLAILLFTYGADACIWISGTKLGGEYVSTTGMTGAWRLKDALKRNLKPEGAQMEERLRGATNFNERSDYAVALMYLGRSSEAVELLERLEKEMPGEYFIAANLGTAFELAGQNENALQWIREGMNRDPDSHEGTEWLHVKILEAKIAHQKDADYFKKHSVLELQPELAAKGMMVGNTNLPPAALAEAIQYQLAERLQFVKPPDPAVASLLFDYAAIEAGTRTLESAKTVLQMAVEYGYPTDRVQAQTKIYDRQITWRKTKQYGFYALIVVGTVGLLVLLRKAGIFVLSSRDLKTKQPGN